MLITSAILCVALNVYHEARGESLTGQHAVAQVTMNRANRNPDNACRVVGAPSQFSWTIGKVRVTKGGGLIVPKHLIPHKDDPSWQLSKAVAKVVVNGWARDFTKGSTYYHSITVKPRWRHGVRLTYVIGRHKFYAVA